MSGAIDRLRAKQERDRQWYREVIEPDEVKIIGEGETPSFQGVWSADRVYNKNESVTYPDRYGAFYVAQWNTAGERPGQDDVWRQVGVAIEGSARARRAAGQSHDRSPGTHRARTVPVERSSLGDLGGFISALWQRLF